MREFSSLSAFAEHLDVLSALAPAAELAGVAAAAKIIQAEAKAEIGHYQDQAGPFSAWRELADRTKADRLRKGFTENDPLLRTGEMRDSVETTVHATAIGAEAAIGSNSQIAEWQELGTSKMPPRSFLGGAAVRKGEEATGTILEAIGALVAGLPPKNTP